MKTVGSDGGKQVPGGSVSILELLPLSEPARLVFFETALYSANVQLCTVLHLDSAWPAGNMPRRANSNPDFVPFFLLFRQGTSFATAHLPGKRFARSQLLT